MRKIKIKKQLHGAQVTRKLEKTEHINTIELDILKKNEIATLFPPQETLEIQKAGLCYTIRDCSPLSGILAQEIGFDLFCRLALDLVHTIQECNAHGIRSSNLELNAESVFYDEEENTFRFLFWPLVTLEDATDFREEFRSLGLRYRPLAGEEEGREKYLAFFESRAKFSIAQMEKHILALIEWQKKRGGPAQETRRLAIVEMGTLRRTEVESFPFIVGRSQEQCSLSCPGDGSMSRRHFSLYEDGGVVYLTDLGSSNGTILNETTFLSPKAGMPTPDGLTRLSGNPQIMHGDHIRAGKTVFRCLFE